MYIQSKKCTNTSDNLKVNQCQYYFIYILNNTLNRLKGTVQNNYYKLKDFRETNPLNLVSDYYLSINTLSALDK